MIVLIIGVVIYVILRKNGINNKGVYTTGVITGISSEVRGNIHLNYMFAVGKVKYHRFSTTLYCTDCGNSCCVVGDTVIVKYQKDNPKNSALVYKSAKGEKLYY
jgi:hypothetical protein